MGTIIFDNNKIDLKDNYIIEIEYLRSSIPFEINNFDNQQLKFCFINCNIQLNFKNKYKIVNGNEFA